MIRAACVLCVLLLSPLAAFAETTSLPGGFEIELLSGFKHEKLQGFDSIVGKIVSPDGLQIMYEIGGIPKVGEPRVGGGYINHALNEMPKADRLWLKQQTVNGRKFDIAYRKGQLLLISVEFDSQGVNFSATAKDPSEIADVLLMVLTLENKKP